MPTQAPGRKFTADEARTIGGRLKIDWNDVDLEQFRQGLEVEMEHGKRDEETDVTHDDLIATGKIAWAHLKEVPDYYKRLKKVEYAEDHTSDLIIQQSLDQLAKKPGDKKAAGKLAGEVKRRIMMKRVRIDMDGMLAMDDEDGERVDYMTDIHGREHKPAGNSDGGQFAGGNSWEDHLQQVGANAKQIADMKSSLADKDGILTVGPKGAKFLDAFHWSTGTRDPQEMMKGIKPKKGEKLYAITNAAQKRIADDAKYLERVSKEGEWDSGNLTAGQQKILQTLVDEGKLTKRKGRADEMTASGIPDIYEPTSKSQKLAKADGKTDTADFFRAKPQQGRLFSSDAERIDYESKGKSGGHWITIGAKRGADGEKHGGTPVYVEGGKITKGHPSLTGKKIGNLSEPAERSEHHKRLAELKGRPEGTNREESAKRKEASRLNASITRADNTSSLGYAKAVMEKKARKMGIDKDSLHSLAAEMKSHHNATANDIKSLLQTARDYAKRQGINVSHMNRQFHGGDVAGIAGFDTLARQLAGEYPHILGAHGYSSEQGYDEDATEASEKLFELLQAGNPEVMSEEQAYEEAFDYLASRAHEQRQQQQPDDEDVVPFINDDGILYYSDATEAAGRARGERFAYAWQERIDYVADASGHYHKPAGTSDGGQFTGHGGSGSRITPTVEDIQSKSHKFADIASGKHPVGVEGRGGKDLKEARRLGLYINTINGVTFFAKNKASAAELESYLQSGGKYGTPEFSKALGYSDSEIDEYKRFLAMKTAADNAKLIDDGR